jgi:ABC-type molybdate transport system substrate-binding protein
VAYSTTVLLAQEAGDLREADRSEFRRVVAAEAGQPVSEVVVRVERREQPGRAGFGNLADVPAGSYAYHRTTVNDRVTGKR